MYFLHIIHRKVGSMINPESAPVRLLLVDNLSSPLMPFVGTDDIQEAFTLSLQVASFIYFIYCTF
jgi:hypothetical protein